MEKNSQDSTALPSTKYTHVATTKNFYEVLGVSPDASRVQITKAYREMALIYHPDKAGNDLKKKEIAEDAFKNISNAYQTLSDPNQRAAYDLSLKQGGDLLNQPVKSIEPATSVKIEPSSKESLSQTPKPENQKSLHLSAHQKSMMQRAIIESLMGKTPDPAGLQLLCQVMALKNSQKAQTPTTLTAISEANKKDSSNNNNEIEAAPSVSMKLGS